ncbi:MAG: hypothetical protein ABEK01_00525 [Candidatus Nanohaloarchaea archaeon]
MSIRSGPEVQVGEKEDRVWDVDRLDEVVSHGDSRWALENDDVRSVGTIWADWAAKDSRIGEIDLLTGRLENVQVDEIREIDTGDVGRRNTWQDFVLDDVELEKLGDVRSNLPLTWESEIGEVEGDVDVDGIAFQHTEIGEVRGEVSAATAFKWSEIDVFEGDIHAGTTAFDQSDVSSFSGEVDAKTVMQDSTAGEMSGTFDAAYNAFSGAGIGVIDGDIRAGRIAFDESDIDLVTGTVEAEDVVFRRTHRPMFVGESVRSDGVLDEKSFGGIVAADEVEVGQYRENMFVVTPEEDEFADYTGDDWEGFKDELESLSDSLEASRLFNIDVESVSGIEEIERKEKELQEMLGESSVRELSDEIEYVHGFSGIDDEYFAQTLLAAGEEMETVKKEDVQEFGEVFQEISEQAREQLVENLETGKENHKPGRDLFNMGKHRKYSEFLEDEAEALEALMTGEDSGGLEKMLEQVRQRLEDGFIESDDFFEEDSPYREVLEELYRRHSDEVRELERLATGAGIDLEFDTESLLKKWEGERQHAGREREVRMDDLGKKFRDEIETKKREYTVEAVENLGKMRAREYHEEVTGEWRDDLDWDEIMVLKAHKEYDKNQESAAHILEHGEDVYTELEENREWIEEAEEEFRITLEELTSFSTEKNMEDMDRRYERKKSKKLEEMEHKLEELDEILEEDHDPDSFEDFRRLAEELETPSDSRARRLHNDIFRNDLSEFRSLVAEQESKPEELHVRVADPVESVSMGNYFTDSCFAIGKFNGWAAVANAVDANKQVLYAEDEDGEVVGRVLTGITDSGELSYFTTYSNTNADLDDKLEEAVHEFGDRLGLEVVERDTSVRTLAADTWQQNGL